VCGAIGSTHPLLAPFFKETTLFEEGTVHDEGSVHLPFCEVPFQYSDTVAQLPSFILHLPFVPLFLFACRAKYLLHTRQQLRNTAAGSGAASEPPSLTSALGIEATILHFGSKVTGPAMKMVAWQAAFQLWTAVGHWIPNPRKILIQEVAMLVSIVYIKHILDATSETDERGRVPTVDMCQLLVFMFAVYGTFGLMPTISLTSGLLFFVCPSIIMPDLTPVAKKTLLGIGLFCLALLTIETRFCDGLLAMAPVSWHAPFDLLFWQVLWSAFDYMILSDAGSVWRVKQVSKANTPMEQSSPSRSLRTKKLEKAC
jgi:hypothetical protein